MSNACAKIVVFLSGHGFGHTIRTATILTALSRVQPISLRIVTSAPSSLWPRELRSVTSEWIEQDCDPAVTQQNDTCIDVARTREEVLRWGEESGARIEGFERCLRPAADLVVVDVPPLPIEAAAACGMPTIAIANFSWDWIYSEMGIPGAAADAATAYAKASLLIELTPSAPMPAFPTRRTVGTVCRTSSATKDEVRRRLGIEDSKTLVLFALRAVTLEHVRLPKSRDGCAFLAVQPPPSLLSQGCIPAPNDVEFIDAVVASDLIVSKPGYGVIGDCMGSARPLLWAPRRGFPEDRVLEPWLERQPWAHRIEWAQLTTAEWGNTLRVAAHSLPPQEPASTSAIGDACEEIRRVLT